MEYPTPLTTPLTDHHTLLYECVVGSTAYGLNGPQSDLDIRGVFLHRADDYRGLVEPVQYLDNKQGDNDAEYWELRHYLNLLLKANPNVLETLWSPLYKAPHDRGKELRQFRHKFLSKRAYMTYNGFSTAQFKKIEGDLRNTGEVKWKHAMHLLRMLHSGIHLMKAGEVLVDVTEYDIPNLREFLLAVRAGERTWTDVQAYQRALSDEFQFWYRRTELPEEPDYNWANSLLVESRRGLDGH
jgi:predicted nucleotidyltransferase